MHNHQAPFERAETDVLDPERACHGSKDCTKLSVVPYTKSETWTPGHGWSAWFETGISAAALCKYRSWLLWPNTCAPWEENRKALRCAFYVPDYSGDTPWNLEIAPLLDTDSCLMAVRRMMTNPNFLPDVVNDKDLCSRKRWKYAQVMTQLFWKRWLQEYRSVLMEHQKRRKDARNVCEGDLVLFVNTNSPRGCWPLGRVLRAFPGDDERVRAAEIRIKTGTYIRPLVKLRLLENAK